MRKILAAVLAVLLLVSLSACSGVKGITFGVETDYPVMIMVDGTLYYGSVSRYEGAVDEAAVKTVTSYTDAVPKKDGECNFDRSLKTKYILTEQGLAVLRNGEWRLFRAEGQDAEPYVPAGKIRFYTGATRENNTPVIEWEDALAEGQVKGLKALLENVVCWMDDDLCDRLGFTFDGEFEFEGDTERYRFSYENSVIYHDHYFAEIPEEHLQYIRDIDAGSRWGLTLAAENVSSDGMTLRLIRSGGLLTGDLMTGSEFWLEAWDEARLCAEPLPTAPECVDWDAVGITIPADATTELTIDWTFLYGSLKPGRYRLGKQILVSGSGGGNENAELHVYFDVA